VPKDHFLVKLNEVVPWQRFTYKLVKYYRGKAKEGRPPYDPAVLLKMLLVSYLYDISERQAEEVANLNLAVKYFLGLAVDEAPPDHSTLTAFKRRILENGKAEALEKVVREIVRVPEVCHPGLHDRSGAELEEDGEAADRGELQRQSQVECLIPRDECAR